MKFLGRFVRGVLVGVLVVVFVLAALLAALPSVVSSQRVKNMVLDKVNSGGAVKVAVRSWDFAWLANGVRVEGLEIVDPAGAYTVTVDSLATRSGLLRLLSGKIQIEPFVVNKPVITVLQKATVETQAARPPAGVEGAGRESRPAKLPKFIEKISVSAGVQVRGAELARVVDGERKSCPVPDVDLDIFLSSLQGPVEVKALVRRMPAGGEAVVLPGGIELKAKVALVAADGSPAGTPETQFELQADRYDLAAFSRIATLFNAQAPAFSGTLNAKLDAYQKQSGEFGAGGTIAVTPLALSGGFLGSDAPVFDAIELALRAEGNAQEIFVRECRLRCPVGSLSLAGRMQPALPAKAAIPVPPAEMTLAFEADLAKLAAMLPNLLRLKKGLEVRQAQVTADAKVGSDAQTLTFECKLSTGRFEARDGKSEVILEAPLLLNAKGYWNAQGPGLESFDLKSFAGEASGHGTPADLQVTFHSDLSKAWAELSRIVDPGLLRLQGILQADVRLKMPTPGRPSVAITAGATGFQLAGLTPNPLRLDSLQSTISAQAQQTAGGGVMVSNVSARLVTSLGEVNLTLGSLCTGAAGALPRVDGLEVQARTRLQDLVALGRDLGVVTQTLEIAGDAALKAQASFDGNTLTLAPSSLEVTGFACQVPDKGWVREPRVAVSGTGQVQLQEGFVRLDDLQLFSESAAIRCVVEVRDFRKKKEVEARGSLACDFDRLAALAAALGQGPIEISGKSEKPFMLKTRLENPDWRQVLQCTEAAVGLSFDRLKYMGIVVGAAANPPAAGGATTPAQGADVQLSLRDSVASLNLDTRVNGGKLRLAPMIDVRGNPMVLVLPERSEVLNGVALTEELASELLGRIHPFFQGCAVVGGTVGLTVDRCAVPLESNLVNKAAVEARVMVRDVELVPGGMLGMLLERLKLGDKHVRIKEREFTAALRNGRILTSPLEIEAGDYALTLSGSVGVDGTLDYSAEVPLTRELVGRDGYRLLQGKTLRIPVSGTAKKPTIVWKALEDSLAQLAVAAATEAAQQRVQEEAGKLLQNLMDGGKKKKAPASTGK